MHKYDPHKRDASWQMIQPGCYIDPAGYAHIFPDEILAYLGAIHPEAGFDPLSESDYTMVVWHLTKALDELYPGMKFKFIKHQREKQ